MNMLSKYKLWMAGRLCLVVIGLIVGATRPKSAYRGPPASPDVRSCRLNRRSSILASGSARSTDSQCRRQSAGHRLPAKAGLPGSAYVGRDSTFEIDRDPFRRRLTRPKGQLAQPSRPGQCPSGARQTELDVNRYTPLAKEQAR